MQRRQTPYLPPKQYALRRDFAGDDRLTNLTRRVTELRISDAVANASSPNNLKDYKVPLDQDALTSTEPQVTQKNPKATSS